MSGNDRARLALIVGMIADTMEIADDADQPLVAALLADALERAKAALDAMECD
ncbi:hypothetical protein [Sphingomonas sp. Leaf357]|uniref:hypothetical protein n=1 Tax=Sphingomonas sp. Leaf357 TaxID=1736350 RepID=UPI0012E2EE15|nr:hypothetical protein [Sphingomonas sp. Leaf357]